MNVSVTLPFIVNGETHHAEVTAYVNVSGEYPDCIIHEVRVNSMHGPLPPFGFTSEDMQKIEQYVWTKFNECMGHQIVVYDGDTPVFNDVEMEDEGDEPSLPGENPLETKPTVH